MSDGPLVVPETSNRAHAASHGSGGADPVTVAISQVAGLGTALGSLATDVGTVDGRVDEVAADVDAVDNRLDLAIVDIANKVSEGDSRLTDARAPTAHASTHLGGGSDTLVSALYEVDFGAVGDSMGFGNGTVVIGGKSWTAANTGNATSFSTVVGSGIVLSLNANNSNLADTTRTAPMLTIPLASLSAAASLAHETRVWIMFSTASMNQVSESAVLALESNAYSSTNFTRFEIIRQVGNGPAHQWSTRIAANGITESSYTVASTAELDHDVVLFRKFGPTTVEVYTGASVGGAWPAMSTMLLRAVLSYYPAAGFVAGGRTLGSSTNAPGVLLGAFTGNTSGNLVVTFKKLRLEASFL